MNHPFLQFNPNNAREAACIAKRDFLWARRGKFGVPRRLNWAMMTQLNQKDRLEEMISYPLARLVNIEQPVYLELAIEFFATYQYEKPVGAEDTDFRYKRRVTFRMARRWHNWTVGRLGRKLGIYTREEMEDETIFTDIYDFPNIAARNAFWAEITEGARYDPRMSKASRIRDPLVRAMHHIFSHTICGRKDSQGNCPTPDLLYLWELVNQPGLNLAARMADYFVNCSGRVHNSFIFGAEYITEIAINENVMTDEVVESLHLVTEGDYIDIPSLKAMRLIVETPAGDRLKGLNNEIWDPLPPAAAAEDEEMHDQDDPEQEHEHQPPTPPNEQHHGFQHHEWPEGLPSYPEFYQQFQQMQVNQENLYQGVSTGLSYLFGEMHQAYPDYFQNPPQFPPWNPPGDGGAGPSNTRQDDDDEE